MSLFSLKEKLFILLSCLAMLYARGQNGTNSVNNRSLTPQNTIISVNFNNISLADALRIIEDKSNIGIIYTDSDMDNQKYITYKTNNTFVTGVLEHVLKNTGLYYKVYKSNIIIYRSEKNKKVLPSIKNGTIQGIITDENGEPLPGAAIWVFETKTGTISDFNGTYKINLSPGIYNLEVSYVSYQKEKIPDITVKPGTTTPLSVSLKPSTTTIGAVTVVSEYKQETVEALYAKQKSMLSVSDGISAEQIKTLPASDVAQVLKKVSGLTVQNDKYVTVRGMSERYNNVLLNGSSLPSTEPNRRNFSFDIIPSNLIDNIVVHKTFTPDLPGEFSGGLVNVNTIDVPEKAFISFSAGTGFNTNSTGKGFRTTKRFASDYFGGGNKRCWRASGGFDITEFSKYYTSQPSENYKYLEELNRANATVPNHFGLYNYTARPFQSYSFSIGNAYKLNNYNSIGIVAAASYRHEEKTEDFDARYRHYGDTTAYAYTYKFNTTIGGVASIAWKHKAGQKIIFNNLYNRKFRLHNTEQEKSILDGVGSDYEYYSSALINTLWQSRLEGSHNILHNSFNFTWFADYNKLVRDQPDDRSSVASIDERTGEREYLLSYDFNTISPGDGLFIFSTGLEESRKNLGTGLEYKFNLFDNAQKLKVGYWGTFRNVAFDQLGLKIKLQNTTGNEMSGLPDYELANPENFLNSKLYYAVSQSTTSEGKGASQYSGKQDIHAAFLMTELSPAQKIKFSGGLRMEKSSMDVHTKTRIPTGDPGNPIQWTDTTINYTETEYLPSLSFIYKITGKTNIRAAYSKTLARPDFRERSHYKYYDLEERADILGNGGLESSYSKNFDMRFEWFPAPGEIISVSAFYKNFIKPVEMVSYNKQSGGYIIFYFNLDNSVVKGIEVDMRKSLGFLVPDNLFWSGLYIAGNGMLMSGNVKYNAIKLSNEAQGLEYTEGEENTVDSWRERPLQGLSPYIINASLGYQGELLGVSLNYNRAGKKMVLAGTKNAYDEYMAPRNQVDIQFSALFLDKRLKMKFNISDLLAEDYIIYRNINNETGSMDYNEDPKGLNFNPGYDWVLKRIRKGTGHSISLSYKF